MNLDRAAEQAVLGAILLEPERHEDVRAWLEPDDFEGTAERQAYEAIQALAARQAHISPQAVDHELRLTHGSVPGLNDVGFVVGAMGNCPDPARVAVYGRMVLELSIRRRVGTRAADLRQRAENAVTADDLNRVFVTVDSARRDVERLHAREAQAAGAFSPAPLNGADLPSLSRPADASGVQLERSAVCALVDQPVALSAVGRWLNSRDFADEECSGLYSQLQLMDEGGDPIDALTVAWRAQGVGIRGLVSESLLQHDRPEELTSDPVVLSRRVLEQSVRAAVLATASALDGLQEVGAPSATGIAYARLNHLWPQQRRLIRSGIARGHQPESTAPVN